MMMEDEVDYDVLLELVTNRIHECVSDLHAVLIEKIGQEAADHILVEAMSANMGNVIGQMDVKKQRKYATQARNAIRTHMLMGAMQKDLHAHGQIGHA
jgi:hypothetical protein